MREGASEDELFADALELPAPDRDRFLTERCAGNVPLREQVESLLDSCANADGFMESSPIRDAAKILSSLLLKTAEAPDGKIGPYTLRQCLGEGGCGVVYLAEQERPISRPVALKVIKQGMDTKAVIARFEAERQALAMMDHPHIAKIFEAGVTPMGRPFFAMELVPGVKVTDYCHRAKLTVAERIELFLPICRAVQHAHQKGIIHRDLKPSNILISLQDGLPIPKLIDFGIAKATQGRLTDLTLLTSADQFIGTPAYMSPEQIGLSGKDIDTRSDLYSLGVVLYELLTGITPFGRDGSKDLTLDELKRRIREDDPLRPSSALARTDISLYYPLCPLKKLLGQIRGDLDWIVLRCLEKDPNLRYQSAHELGYDLGQFLANEPLPNRPSDTWQSFGKFIRKNRTAVVISAAMLAVLVAATSISTWEAIRARRAERLAQTEAAANKAVLNFLRTDLLALASPDNQPDRNLKLRTLVDHAAQKLEEGRFKNQPKVERDIRQTLAETYGSLGLHPQSQHQWEQIFASDPRRLATEDPVTLRALSGLVSDYQMLGKFIQGEELVVKILPTFEKVFGPEHRDTLKLKNQLAWALWGQGKADQAEKILLPTIEALKRTLGPEDANTLNSLYTLTIIYWIQDRTEESIPLLSQLSEIGHRTLGPDSKLTLISMHALASTYLNEDRIAEAEPLFVQVSQSYEKKWGPDYPEAILARLHLATVSMAKAEFGDAEKKILEVIDSARRAIGPDQEYTLEAMTCLATVYRYQGRLNEADATITRARDSEIRVFGTRSPFLSWENEELAAIDEAHGKLSEAESLYRTVLEQKHFWNPSHRERLVVLDSLGHLLIKEEKYAEAEKILRECLGLRMTAKKSKWLTAVTRSLLGESLLKQHRMDEAAPLLEQSDLELKKAADTIPPRERKVLGESESRLNELRLLR